MQVCEAKELLSRVVIQDKSARVNPIFTHERFVSFVKDLLKEKSEDEVLMDIIEKRVWQAFKNQKCPTYKED